MDIFADRRERLRDQLDDRPLVVSTNPETQYSNDVHNRFRPHNDFWYLTGFAEPGATLVMEGDKDTLFVRPRDPKAEIWNGRRMGVERVEQLGMVGQDADQLSGFLKDKEPVVAGAESPWDGDDASPLLAEMRLRKDEFEAEQLLEANRIGCIAMERALACAKPGNYEYHMDAELHATYREHGTWPGYPPIVGAGANAAVLHYTENNARIKDGEFVLVDAGCEWGYYNSDISRTTFVGEPDAIHRDLYALVQSAQDEAIAAVQPGALIRDPHRAATRVLTNGLMDLGLMEKEEHIRRYFMHGTSHWLGLDVHDAGDYKVDEKERALEPGMCLTIEPGLYFNPDFAVCPEQVAGIGIRLENDLLVTDEGHKDLTATAMKQLGHGDA